MKFLFYYYFLINLIGFFIMGLDKGKAKRHLWRIPEAALLSVAALGGALGVFLGMMGFHHKTRKPKFQICVPLLLFIHMVLYVLLTGNLF